MARAALVQAERGSEPVRDPPRSNIISDPGGVLGDLLLRSNSSVQRILNVGLQHGLYKPARKKDQLNE